MEVEKQFEISAWAIVFALEIFNYTVTNLNKKGKLTYFFLFPIPNSQTASAA